MKQNKFPWEKPLTGDDGQFMSYRNRRPENYPASALIGEMAVFLVENDIPYEPCVFFEGCHFNFAIPRRYDDLPSGVKAKTVRFLIVFCTEGHKFLHNGKKVLPEKLPFLAKLHVVPLVIHDRESFEKACERVHAYFFERGGVSSEPIPLPEKAPKPPKVIPVSAAFDLDIEKMDLDGPGLPPLDEIG